MTKKLFAIIVVMAAVVSAGFYFTQNEQEVTASDVFTDNVEALAADERKPDTDPDADVNPLCPNGCVDRCKKGCYCYGWHEEYDEYDGW
ncbi:MAG: NVEALA domain-containing protein [Tannerellaceae bacterium]|jgi:hypothetical protein|nr:NVEALA domain-containing protein [Tannerellaceae bacterium]